MTVGVGALIDPEIFSLLGQTLSGKAMGTEHGVVGLPVAFFVSFTGLAVSVGLAVLRYRLYTIDRIINRTLVYGVITAALGAGYALAIFGLGGILRPFTGGDDLAVAVSTLALLGAFGRVRRRVQMFVDRRFDRARYDAAREIHAFSRRLRGSADLESLSTELQDLVCRTMQPAHASLWLRPIDEAHG